MPTLTPELAGAGFIGSLVVMGIALIFQVYMLFLNWKQSKVKDTTAITNELLKSILKEVIKCKQTEK